MPVETDETTTTEYTLVLDGVIEIPDSTDIQLFFDGLLDAIIDYVESYNALAALGMSYKPYLDLEGDDAGEDDAETA
ncbi:MAG: hypothetical protein AB1791_03545 [Chloroflexota bacterium]